MLPPKYIEIIIHLQRFLNDQSMSSNKEIIAGELLVNGVIETSAYNDMIYHQYAANPDVRKQVVNNENVC